MQNQSFATAFNEKNYTKVIGKALQHDKTTDFSHLRSLYIQMIFYQPNSDSLMNELLTRSARVQAAASKIQDQDGAEDYQGKLKTYTEFVAMHVGHPDVMWMASILAKDDPALGDPAIYAWIYDRLKRLVLGSGDGKTPESAYEIATWGEENLIFGTLGVQRLKTEAISAGFVRYNMHSVYNPETDSTSTLFVNSTYPQRFRDENASNESSPLDFSTFSDHSLKSIPQGEGE